MIQQKCKSCGENIDRGLIMCPHCGCSPNQEPRREGLAPELIKQIEKQVWKKLLVGVFTFLSALSLVFGYGLLQAYWGATKQFQKLLTQKISQEFELPKIHNTVKEVAKNEAEEILKDEIRPEVLNFKTEVKSQLGQLQKIIDSAQLQLDRLTTLTEVEDAARYGSRKAFTKLIELSQTNDYYGTMAQRRVAIIVRDLSIFQSVPGAYFGVGIKRDGKDVEAGQLTTAELFRVLESPSTAREYISPLMAHISGKPKIEVCQEAIGVLKTSDSLPACAATCGILKKVLGEKARFLDFDNWVKACEAEIQ